MCVVCCVWITDLQVSLFSCLALIWFLYIDLILHDFCMALNSYLPFLSLLCIKTMLLCSDIIIIFANWNQRPRCNSVHLREWWHSTQASTAAGFCNTFSEVPLYICTMAAVFHTCSGMSFVWEMLMTLTVGWRRIIFVHHESVCVIKIVLNVLYLGTKSVCAFVCYCRHETFTKWDLYNTYFVLHL